MAKPENSSWALPYALEWLSVQGDQLVMAPWVRQFQEASRLVRRLRDTGPRRSRLHLQRHGLADSRYPN